MFGCFSVSEGETKREKVDKGFGKNICVAYFPFGRATAKHIFKALKHFGFRKCSQFKIFVSCLALANNTLGRLSRANIQSLGLPVQNCIHQSPWGNWRLQLRGPVMGYTSQTWVLVFSLKKTLIGWSWAPSETLWGKWI